MTLPLAVLSCRVLLMNPVIQGRQSNFFEVKCVQNLPGPALWPLHSPDSEASANPTGDGVCVQGVGSVHSEPNRSTAQSPEKRGPSMAETSTAAPPVGGPEAPDGAPSVAPAATTNPLSAPGQDQVPEAMAVDPPVPPQGDTVSPAQPEALVPGATAAKEPEGAVPRAKVKYNLQRSWWTVMPLRIKCVETFVHRPAHAAHPRCR